MIDVVFEETNQEIKTDFGEVYNISDGGFERGYAEGYEQGRVDFSVLTQEKTIDIIANETVSVIPDEGYVLSRVTANVNVPTGGDDTEIVDAVINRSVTDISSNTTEVGYYAFSNCTKLINVNFPNVVTVSGYGFQNCSSLQNVNLPKLQGINGYGFYGCTSLKHFDFPNARSIGNYAFRKCVELTKVDLYETYNINVYAFYECSNLETVILRKTDKPCTISGTNALQKTKIEDGTGFIYVPKALVDSYKTATNWSTYASQIRAIEDYPEICGG